MYAVVSVILLLLCSCAGGDLPETTGGTMETNMEILSFSFSHSGMSAADCYLYSAEKEASGVRLYTEDLYYGGRTVDVLTEEALLEQLSEVVERHDIQSWNGFSKVDENVLDGTGFTLSITFADGRSVRAKGNNAFPDGYEDAKAEICALFGELIDQHSATDQSSEN